MGPAQRSPYHGAGSRVRARQAIDHEQTAPGIVPWILARRDRFRPAMYGSATRALSVKRLLRPPPVGADLERPEGHGELARDRLWIREEIAFHQVGQLQPAVGARKAEHSG